MLGSHNIGAAPLSLAQRDANMSMTNMSIMFCKRIGNDRGYKPGAQLL